MKSLLIAAVLCISSMARAAEVFKIEGGGPDGICLKGFVQNEAEKVCIKPPAPDGKKIVTKEKGFYGCAAPWTEKSGRCVAVLKVMPLKPGER